MADTFSKEIRRKTMQAVKFKNTKLEKSVFFELWSRGFRFRKNVSSLYGKPDLAVKKYKIVVFLDSCFWHGCKRHCRVPQTNRTFWLKKIKKNRRRDIKITKHYERNGWHILRIWGHETSIAFDKTINRISSFLMKHKNIQGGNSR